MAETELLKFEFKEVTTALVKQAGLRAGIWGIYVEFGIAAGNVSDASTMAYPTALVPILKIGLKRVTAVDNLSVDAAEVNPGPTPTPAKPSQKKLRAPKPK